MGVSWVNIPSVGISVRAQLPLCSRTERRWSWASRSACSRANRSLVRGARNKARRIIDQCRNVFVISSFL